MRCSWLKRFVADRRGAVAVIVLAYMGVVLAALGLAVDVGSVFTASRKLQGMADLAAMAAANDLGDAASAAQATANSNGWSGPVSAATTLGDYQASSSIPVAQRFQPGAPTTNAAKVTLTADADLFFGRLLIGQSKWTLSRSATAAQAALASFSIGSRLLAIQGGAANALLSALTGSQISLTAVDYNSLASANVNLLGYANALQAQVGKQGSSLNTVLSTNLSTGAALEALVQVLQAHGSNAAQAVQALATAAGAGTPVNLSQLLDLGPYGEQDHGLITNGSAIQIDALDLADAILTLGQNGHLVQLDLTQTLPGLSQVTAWLAIGQRPSNSPWIAVDDAGQTTVYTTQARLYVDTKIAPASGALTALGVSLVDLPVLVEIASAEAKLASMNCSGGPTAQYAVLSVAPSVGDASIASINTAALNDFTHPVTQSPAILLSVPLVKVTGQAQVDIGGQDWQSVSFSQSDVQAQTVKTVTTNNIAQSTASTLLGDLNLNVSVAGLNLGLNPATITAPLQSTLSSVTPTLDSLINGLTGVLGVGLGQADVRLDGLRCGQAALVA
jgi:uncharacterized membrane protein